jgi:hypothetical protein
MTVYYLEELLATGPGLDMHVLEAMLAQREQISFSRTTLPYVIALFQLS